MRAVLLSDPEFLKAVQDRYVLAWDMVRPVPKVTIDFGNGHTLKRTLKGSTVFYLCRPDGTVVDAFPGIYTPADFLPMLRESEVLLTQDDEHVRDWHARRQPGEGRPVDVTASKAVMQAPLLARLEPPPVDVTASKAVMQSPVLERLDLPPAPPSTAESGTHASTPFTRYAARLRDLSHQPLSSQEVRERVGSDPIATDSALYRKEVRPGVHFLLAEQMRKAPDCTVPLFRDLLKVPIDDPYLGLKDAELPGTPP